MMGWIVPKTDWTANDYINAEDFARIWNNQNYCNELLLDEIKQNAELFDFELRIEAHIAYLSRINKLESNIRNMLALLGFEPFGMETVQWTLYRNPDYEDVNRWEKVLQFISDYNASIMSNQLHCGGFYCGEDIDLQLQTGVI